MPFSTCATWGICIQWPNMLEKLFAECLDPYNWYSTFWLKLGCAFLWNSSYTKRLIGFAWWIFILEALLLKNVVLKEKAQIAKFSKNELCWFNYSNLLATICISDAICEITTYYRPKIKQVEFIEYCTYLLFMSGLFKWE